MTEEEATALPTEAENRRGSAGFDSFAQWMETAPADRPDRYERRQSVRGNTALARIWANRGRPDPATTDLQVHLVANATGCPGQIDLGAGRYAQAAVPGTCCIAPAFVDCDYAYDEPFELLVLAVPNEHVIGTVREVTQTDFRGFGALHARSWNDARIERLVHES